MFSVLWFVSCVFCALHTSENHLDDLPFGSMEYQELCVWHVLSAFSSVPGSFDERSKYIFPQYEAKAIKALEQFPQKLEPGTIKKIARSFAYFYDGLLLAEMLENFPLLKTDYPPSQTCITICSPNSVEIIVTSGSLSNLLVKIKCYKTNHILVTGKLALPRHSGAIKYVHKYEHTYYLIFQNQSANQLSMVSILTKKGNFECVNYLSLPIDFFPMFYPFKHYLFVMNPYGKQLVHSYQVQRDDKQSSIQHVSLNHLNDGKVDSICFSSNSVGLYSSGNYLYLIDGSLNETVFVVDDKKIPCIEMDPCDYLYIRIAFCIDNIHYFYISNGKLTKILKYKPDISIELFDCKYLKFYDIILAGHHNAYDIYFFTFRYPSTIEYQLCYHSKEEFFDVTSKYLTRIPVTLRSFVPFVRLSKIRQDRLKPLLYYALNSSDCDSVQTFQAAYDLLVASDPQLGCTFDSTLLNYERSIKTMVSEDEIPVHSFRRHFGLSELTCFSPYLQCLSHFDIYDPVKNRELILSKLQYAPTFSSVDSSYCIVSDGRCVCYPNTVVPREIVWVDAAFMDEHGHLVLIGPKDHIAFPNCLCIEIFDQGEYQSSQTFAIVPGRYTCLNILNSTLYFENEGILYSLSFDTLMTVEIGSFRHVDYVGVLDDILVYRSKNRLFCVDVKTHRVIYGLASLFDDCFVFDNRVVIVRESSLNYCVFNELQELSLVEKDPCGSIQNVVCVQGSTFIYKSENQLFQYDRETKKSITLGIIPKHDLLIPIHHQLVFWSFQCVTTLNIAPEFVQ